MCPTPCRGSDEVTHQINLNLGLILEELPLPCRYFQFVTKTAPIVDLFALLKEDTSINAVPKLISRDTNAKIAKRLSLPELFSIEHTKLKPLSIAIATDEKYRILGVQVGKIKASGLLASISYRKYGPRPNESFQKVQALLNAVNSQLKRLPNVIKSDAKTDYKRAVRNTFPITPYLKYSGQEFKEKKREQKYLNQEKRIHDPIFAINHTCARLRDHTKRLARRSWCTTKIPDHLELGIYLYIAKTNQYSFL